jgi:GntR family transcriptional repressor for pyruvate dehydrogenase complex
MNPLDLPIEQPVRQSLPQVVAQQLLELIRSGVLAPGQQLPSEVELKERFGVGRSTIREALNGLVLIGAIEVRHGQGAFVLRNRPDMPGGLDEAIRRSVTEELFEAREAMELASARLAAEHATEEDLQAIHELLDQAEIKVRETGMAVDEASRFHLLIAEAAHNGLFVQFIQMILDDLNERGEDLSVANGYGEWELDAHRELLEAISSGSGQQGQRAMARHLSDMREISFSGWEAFRARTTPGR